MLLRDFGDASSKWRLGQARTWTGLLAAAALSLVSLISCTSLVAAAASGAPRVVGTPLLGRLGGSSNGVALAVETRGLGGPATMRRITINGRSARVQSVGLAADGVYQATASGRSMRAGRRYPVKVELCRRTQCARYSGNLYLHRRFRGRGST